MTSETEITLLSAVIVGDTLPGTVCHIAGEMVRNESWYAHVYGTQMISVSGSSTNFTLIFANNSKEQIAGEVKGCVPQAPMCEIDWSDGSIWRSSWL